MPVTHIDDLKIFARVATARNMSAAGRDMGLSPAVVSKRISGMEERLGARLFQRTTRHLQLTEAGIGFYDRVMTILANIEEAETFLSNGSGEPRGVLKITAPAGFSRLHLAPKFTKFLHKYPHITIDLQASDSIVDIVSERMDLAIRIAVLDDTPLAVRKLAPCRRVLCASPSYLQLHGEPQSIEELDPHNCFAIGVNPNWLLEGPEGQITLKTSGNLRTNSSEVVRECLIAGLGIGLRSTWDVYKELESGQLRVVLPQYRELANAGIYAVYPEREHAPAKLQVFIDFLAEEYGAEPYWDKNLAPYIGAGHLDGGKRVILYG